MRTDMEQNCGVGRLQLDRRVTWRCTEHKDQDMQHDVAFSLTNTSRNMRAASWSSPFLHVRLPPLIGQARAPKKE